jgi:hypothetical protein
VSDADPDIVIELLSKDNQVGISIPLRAVAIYSIVPPLPTYSKDDFASKLMESKFFSWKKYSLVMICLNLG